MINKFKSLPLPSLYYKNMMPRKEINVLKAMLNSQGIALGKLLYNARNDGWNAFNFHWLCDGQGPTVTILRVYDNNNWIGGYTSKSWTSIYEMVPVSDPSAFLFNLTTSSKFNVKFPKYATSPAYCYGPSFGMGDIVVTLKDD